VGVGHAKAPVAVDGPAGKIFEGILHMRRNVGRLPNELEEDLIAVQVDGAATHLSAHDWKPEAPAGCLVHLPRQFLVTAKADVWPARAAKDHGVGIAWTHRIRDCVVESLALGIRAKVEVQQPHIRQAILL